MKIKKIKTHALSAPVKEPFYCAEGWYFSRNALIVELESDDGVIGWGEAMCHGSQSPLLAKVLIDNVLAPFVLGKDLFDVEVIWEGMYNLTQPYGRKGIAVNAISGIDTAIWDCLARTLNVPIYKLLGGAWRTDITPYATGFFRTKKGKYPDDAIDEALAFVDKGFNCMKIKIGFGIEEDMKLLRAIRKAVGPEVKLMVDANCAYNASSARKFLKAVEDLDIFWFEEPIPPDDVEGYRTLKNLTGTYIATGECEFSKHGFRDLINRDAADILQPDVCFSGGFTECRKISALAQAHHVMVVPHAWGSGISLAAALQFVATLPPCPMTFNPIEPLLEFDLSSHPYRQELILGGIRQKGMKVEIPSGPGIGVQVNRKIIEKFTI